MLHMKFGFEEVSEEKMFDQRTNGPVNAHLKPGDIYQ